MRVRVLMLMCECVSELSCVLFVVYSDNGQRRLNTLIKSLLLRRTKHQTNACTGKPLVGISSEDLFEIHTHTQQIYLFRCKGKLAITGLGMLCCSVDNQSSKM